MPKKKPVPYEMRVITAFTNTPTDIENVPEDQEFQEEQSAKGLLIAVIDRSSKQPRRYFDPEKMDQLTASVKQKGVLEPLLVRPKANGRYELVAGERRLRAAIAAGLEKVPCIIHELSDEEASEIALLENLQRDDLNPVEETEGILDLLCIKLHQSRAEVVSYFNAVAHPERNAQNDRVESQEWKIICEIFEIIGRFTPNSFRTNRLPLLKLPSEILEAIHQGKLEYSKARLIGGVKEHSDRKNLLEAAITENLTREDIQQRVRALKKATPRKTEVETENKVVDRLTTVYRKAKKPKIWADTKIRKKMERLLDEIEKLLDE